MASVGELLETHIEQYLSQVSATLTRLPTDTIYQVVQILQAARRAKKQIFLFGNGGSAATASHFANDLAKGAIASNEPRFRAISLTDNVPLLTAWANDSAYEDVFSEQLTNLVQPGDVAVAISSSGQSANVLRAVREASAAGATTIGFAGCNGGTLKDLVDLCIVVPNDCVEQVEDMHLILQHIISTGLRLTTLDAKGA